MSAKHIVIVILYILFCHGFADYANDINKLYYNAQNFKSINNTISSAEWLRFTELGTDTIQKQRRLEETIKKSHVSVLNGSISHIILLDSLPFPHDDSDQLPLRVHKSSQFAYNSKCDSQRISGTECDLYLQKIPLPANSQLGRDCNQFQRNRKQNHSFRRLLLRHYRDGFYEMFKDSEIIPAREISYKLLQMRFSPDVTDSSDRSIAVLLWTQFLEHDLSKPVMTAASGHAIQCCDKDNYALSPRLRHPACNPLLQSNQNEKYGRESCINYVRSSLAIGKHCNFGALEQYNHATSLLDLSQLYGSSPIEETKVRFFTGGRVISSEQNFLPSTRIDYNYCAWNQPTKTCYIAPDARVNSSPLSVAIYAVFLKNHNYLAKTLAAKFPKWSDEYLFQIAKAINVKIYRNIIYNELLPVILGHSKNIWASLDSWQKHDIGVTNEFALAAIRFYCSMIPNEFYSNRSNAALYLKDTIFKPRTNSATNDFNLIIESVLSQKNLKMDVHYAESFSPKSMEEAFAPTQPDLLAVDIQRGRDHGLRPYIDYVKLCHNIEIRDWSNLESLIAHEDIQTLQHVYTTWSEIDLIVGGMSEQPKNGAIVGPTFACILNEQFDKIRQLHEKEKLLDDDNINEIYNQFRYINSSVLFCINSNLKEVQQNTFYIKSNSNSVIKCKDVVS